MQIKSNEIYESKLLDREGRMSASEKSAYACMYLDFDVKLLLRHPGLSVAITLKQLSNVLLFHRTQKAKKTQAFDFHAPKYC